MFYLPWHSRIPFYTAFLFFSSIPNVSLLLLSFRASKPDREVIEKRAKKSFLFRSNVIGVFTWVVFVFRVVATIKQFSI